jgi:hypothetical protein
MTLERNADEALGMVETAEIGVRDDPIQAMEPEDDEEEGSEEDEAEGSE